jgi:hypothetical protein
VTYLDGRLFRIDEATQFWVAQDLIPACMNFIESFCGDGVKNNQNACVGIVPELLALLPYRIDVAGPLSAIFHNNVPLVMNLDLVVIEKIVVALTPQISTVQQHGVVLGRTASGQQAKLPTSSSFCMLLNANLATCASCWSVVCSCNRRCSRQITDYHGRRDDLRDPHYLKFLEDICRVASYISEEHGLDAEGAATSIERSTVPYLLRCLAYHGPLTVDGMAGKGKSASFRLAAGFDESQAQGELEEKALLLFRGETGIVRRRELLREAREVGSTGDHWGMRSEANARELAYNVRLLRLLRVCAQQLDPQSLGYVRYLLPHAMLCRDVTGTSCFQRGTTTVQTDERHVPAAARECLLLFKVLYLDVGLRGHGAAGVVATLWRLLEVLADELEIGGHDLGEQVRLVDFFHGYEGFDYLEQWERGQEAAQLLTNHWLPIIDGLLRDEHIPLSGHENILWRIGIRLTAIHHAPLSNVQAAAKVRESIKHLKSRMGVNDPVKDPDAQDDPMNVASIAPVRLPSLESVPSEGRIVESMRQTFRRKRGLRPGMEEVAADLVSVPESHRGFLRNLHTIAHALHELIDPKVANAEDDGNSLGHLHGETASEDSLSDSNVESDDEAQEPDTDGLQMDVRSEVADLCRDFHGSRMVDGKIQLSALGTALISNVFKADGALLLVDLLCGTPQEDVREWERLTILGCSILRVLAAQWHHAATDTSPPDWMLRGVPGLVIKTVSEPESGDRAVNAALQLAITALDGQVMRELQNAFLSSLSDQNSKAAHAFFTQVRARIRLFEGEAQREAARYREHILADASGQKMPESVCADQGHADAAAHVAFAGIARGLPKRSVSHARTVMRFLHLLCEGHNLGMQDFLRCQPGASHSIDIVLATANAIVAATPYISPLVIDTVNTALLAVAEFVQSPCRLNQRVLIDSPLCMACNTILNLSIEDDFCDSIGLKRGSSVLQHRDPALQALVDRYPSKVSTLKSSCIIVLLSLLECVNEPYIPSRMLGMIDPDRLIVNINGLAAEYAPHLCQERDEAKVVCLNAGPHIAKAATRERVLRSRSCRDLCCTKACALPLSHLISPDCQVNAKGKIGAGATALQPEMMTEKQVAAAKFAEEVAEYFYVTYITLVSYDPSGALRQKLTAEHIWDIVNLRRKVGVIEISRQGVGLEKAYFIIPEVCRYLTDQSRNNLQLSVNRANLQTQLTGFSEAFERLYEEMKHQKKLTENKVLNLFRTTLGWREKLFFYNALTINALYLLFYRHLSSLCIFSTLVPPGALCWLCIRLCDFSV